MYTVYLNYLTVSRSNIPGLKAYNNSHSYARRFLYCEQCLCRKKTVFAWAIKRDGHGVCAVLYARHLGCADWVAHAHWDHILFTLIYLLCGICFSENIQQLFWNVVKMHLSIYIIKQLFHILYPTQLYYITYNFLFVSYYL